MFMHTNHNFQQEEKQQKNTTNLPCVTTAGEKTSSVPVRLQQCEVKRDNHHQGNTINYQLHNTNEKNRNHFQHEKMALKKYCMTKIRKT